MHLRFLQFFFLAVAFFCQLEGAEMTRHTPLAQRFSYVENLYFDFPSTFLAVGDEVQLEKILKTHVKRGYQLTRVPESSNPDIVLEGTTLLCLEYPTNFSFHFFHLLEHIAGMWAFYGHDHADRVKQIILAGDGLDERQNWMGPNQINYHLLTALFPKAKVQTWRGFLQEYNRSLVRFECLITSDRAIDVSDPECINMNKHLSAARAYIDPHNLQSLADRVHAYAQITKQKKNHILRITYLKRPPPRRLIPEIEDTLIASLRQLPNAELTVSDFAYISFKEQIQIIANTDVLMSVHGNGLSHVLFLPPTARVLEIFPPNNHHLDYHLFADIRGLNYYGLLYRDNHFINNEHAYQMGAYGNPKDPIDELDIDLIVSTIQSWTEK